MNDCTCGSWNARKIQAPVCAWCKEHNDDVPTPYQPRRPWADDEPDGMLESDRDYVTNNLDLAVELLDKLHADQTALADEIIDEILEEERTWVHVAEGLPDAHEDYGAFNHSREVLVVAEGRIHLAYVQRDDYADDGTIHTGWKIAGRDGYGLDGVTHWRGLPATPRSR